jgi:hypothetical protein
MGGVIMKMNVGDKFVRRRGKALCVIDAIDGLNVTYHTWPEKTIHKVSPSGFRLGFRPATAAEIPEGAH